MDSVLREKWFELSLVQQMVNIGNEVKRGLKFYSDTDKRNMFFQKAYNGRWQKCTCITGIID